MLRPRLADRRFDVIIDTKRKLRATLELKRVPHTIFVSGTVNGLLSERRAPGQPWRPAKPAHFLDQLMQLLSLARYGRVDGPVDPGGRVEVPVRCRHVAAQLLPEGDSVLIAPGARGAKKKWSLANFVALARAMQSLGYTPIVALGPNEEGLHGELANALPDARFPLQEVSPRALADEPFLTMALAQRVLGAVANDSGNAHILAAAGVPLVVLFGPTSAEKFTPIGRNIDPIKAQEVYAASIDHIPVQPVVERLVKLIGATWDRVEESDDTLG